MQMMEAFSFEKIREPLLSILTAKKTIQGFKTPILGTLILNFQLVIAAKPQPHYTIADKKSAMVAAYATGDYTMQEIATCFSVHYATVSRAVRQKQKTSMLDCKT